MDDRDNGERGSAEGDPHATAAHDDPRHDSAKPNIDQKQDAEIRQLERRERSLFLLAWLGFAIAFGSLAVSYLQWRSMREQLADARAQYQQGRLDAEADARVQAGRFERQARLMGDSNQALKDAIGTIQTNAAIEQSLSRRSLEMTLRARIDVDHIPRLETKALGAESGASIILVLRNFGSLPATDVRFRIHWMVREVPLPDDFAAHIVTEDSLSRLAISGRNTANVPIHFVKIDTGTIEALEAKKKRLYLVGAATYNDGFRNRRTEFCTSLDVRDGGWTSCPNNTRVE